MFFFNLNICLWRYVDSIEANKKHTYAKKCTIYLSYYCVFAFILYPLYFIVKVNFNI